MMSEGFKLLELLKITNCINNANIEEFKIFSYNFIPLLQQFNKLNNFKSYLFKFMNEQLIKDNKISNENIIQIKNIFPKILTSNISSI